MSSPSILRLSAALHRITGAVIVLLPLAAVVMLGQGISAPDVVAARFPGLTISPGPGTAIAAGLVGALPLAAAIYALVQMRALFGLYRDGEILTAASAARIQRIGQGLFAIALLGPVTHTIQALILTWNNPPGQRALVIGLESSLLGFLLAGALMILIGRVMVEAARMAEENRSFV